MQTKETITLSGVPETMLQTVYARAKESCGRGAIRDRKAEEIIGGLAYDFTLADSDKAMHSGVVARTIVLDRLTGAWLREHKGGVVVNIACGLDTRCYRMQGYDHWYNLDLPETIAVRQRLLPEDGAISQIAMSARGTLPISSSRRTSLIWSPHLRQFTSGRTFCRVSGKSTECSNRTACFSSATSAAATTKRTRSGQRRSTA